LVPIPNTIFPLSPAFFPRLPFSCCSAVFYGWPKFIIHVLIIAKQHMFWPWLVCQKEEQLQSLTHLTEQNKLNRVKVAAYALTNMVHRKSSHMPYSDSCPFILPVLFMGPRLEPLPSSKLNCSLQYLHQKRDTQTATIQQGVSYHFGPCRS
jgi:hypothetical protein